MEQLVLFAGIMAYGFVILGIVLAVLDYRNNQSRPWIPPPNPFAESTCDEVECFPAGAFVCELCGTFNFFAMIAIDREIYTRRELEQFSRHVSPDYVGQALYLNPTHVSCSACLTTYKLRPSNNDETTHSQA